MAHKKFEDLKFRDGSTVKERREADRLTKRFRFLYDDDGHDYLVEVGKEDAFQKWLEAGPYWENYEGEEFESIGRSTTCYTFLDPKSD